MINKVEAEKTRKASDLGRKALYVAAIMSFIGTLFVGCQNKKLQECQQRYATANREASVLRADAADARQKAFDLLLSQFLTARNREESRRLLEEYVKARKAEQKLRDENPIPDPPEEFCREE